MSRLARILSQKIMIKVCIVGLGNIGQPIFDALSSLSMFKVSGCKRADDPNKCIEKSEVLIIAVKPQSFKGLAQSISADLTGKSVISIMAGVSIDRIMAELNVKKVIRVMPNLPLKVGKSLSAFICSKAINQEEKFTIQSLLEVFGEVIEVDNEAKIDAITALSGTGPAYFCYLVEALQKAAKKYGFSDEEAKKIIKTTFFGTAELMSKENLEADDLRAKITSKGGTTKAAIEFLEKKKFEEIMIDAVTAARKRAEELNQ